MKSRLDAHGKLIPPKSKEEAQVRQQQLSHELSKMNGNRKASGARGWLAAEEKQLSAWMKEHGVEPLPKEGP